MFRILYNSECGMRAQQQKLDDISNNIANMGTTGYKSSDVQFSDLVYEALNRKGYPVSNNAQANYENGTGVKASSCTRDETQGIMSQTGVNTDLFINGDGYFSVKMPDGSLAYTRDGNFKVDTNGHIVDNRGNYLNIDFFKNDGNGNLVDKDGNIKQNKLDAQGNILDTNANSTGININNEKFTADNFKVDEKGNVFLSGKNGAVNIGKINIYTGNEQAFTETGDNLFVSNQGAQIVEAKNSNIVQGALELSNVNLSKELTDMIITQRAFELSSKGMKAADDMWTMANNLRK